MKSRIHRMPSVLPAGRLRSPKPAAPPRFRRLGAWLFLLGFGAGVYWYFWLGPAFAVEHVEIVGADNPSLLAIADHLNGQNIFRLHSESLEQDMRAAYPPVATIEMVRGLPHTVRIRVQLRDPALRWQTNNDVYILDANGQIFEQGDKPVYEQLPKIVDKSGVSLKIGQQIISPDFIQFIEEVKKQVPDMFKRTPQTVEITETTFHVDVLLEGDVRLRLTTQRPSKEQLESAQAILNAHPEAKSIDVRVTQWGYWKT